MFPENGAAQALVRANLATIYQKLSPVITLTLLHPSKSTPLQQWTFEDESVIRVGRGIENNVVLYSVVVSRHHLDIRQTQAGWELESFGANGTFLDGKRIQKISVDDGMIIRLASSGPAIQIHLNAPQCEQTSPPAHNQDTLPTKEQEQYLKEVDPLETISNH